MSTTTLERPATTTAELNHSCTAQCPNPCPYAASVIILPEVDTTPSPVMNAS